MVKRHNYSSRAVRTGEVISSTVKGTGRNIGEGASHVARGIGFGARQVANIFTDFGRGLKKGWQKS